MATIERAVLKATIGSAVEVRNIFTCEITEVGADTSELLWDVYMEDLVTNVCDFLHTSVHFYAYDVYQLQAGQWVLLDEVTMDEDGQVGTEAILNAAAVVFIGKAEGIRHMGRKFFSGLSEAMVTGNAVPGAYAANLATALSSYIAPVTGIGGGTLVPGTVDKNGSFWPFVGGVVSSLLGTMRRRKPGNGI